jgi:hypothetical protein
VRIRTKNAIRLFKETGHAAYFHIAENINIGGPTKAYENREIAGELLNKVSYVQLDANCNS